jgi:AcrR family transcriptional regulator
VSRRSPSTPRVSVAPLVPLRERFRREVTSSLAAAAEQVFAEEGLHSAHVGNIAKRAGVAVGTLYNHFEDRDALLAALLGERGVELTGALGAALASAEEGSVEAQLRAFVDAYFTFFLAHRPYFKILLEGELTQLQASYPRSAAIPAQCHQEVFAQLERVFRRAVDAGDVRADRAHLYPWLLLGMMRSLAVRDLRKGHPYRPSDGAAVVDVFLRGAGEDR